MKKSELQQMIKEEIVNILQETTIVEPKSKDEDIKRAGIENAETRKMAMDKAKKTNKPVTIAEFDDDDDLEPTAKDIRKNDSFVTSANKLRNITKEMKDLVGKWKVAEGPKKEEYLVRLKQLTAMKKQLEASLNLNIDQEF
jgi:hypothetical protein